MDTILASACLLGRKCRWDGGFLPEGKMLALRRGVIPFCPEQLGGLATPRAPSRILGGDGLDVLAGRARVVDSAGGDVTAQFIRGAKCSLRLARLYRA